MTKQKENDQSASTWDTVKETAEKAFDTVKKTCHTVINAPAKLVNTAQETWRDLNAGNQLRKIWNKPKSPESTNITLTITPIFSLMPKLPKKAKQTQPLHSPSELPKKSGILQQKLLKVPTLKKHGTIAKKI